MQLIRRYGAPLLAIGVLIGLSVLAVVSIGEGFKLFVVRSDGVRLRRRDGSTITFNVPWNPPKLESQTEVKAVDPIEGALLNVVGAVASALLGNGMSIASNVQAQASIITATIIPINTNLASAVLGGGTTQLPSAISAISSEVNKATGVVGQVVSAADSIVGGMVTEAMGVSNIGIPLASASSSTNHSISLESTTSEPQEFLPQTNLCATCNSSQPRTALAHNITSAPLFSLTSTDSVLPMAPSCTPISTCSFCPLPVTQTCTVTETWHSTHYAATATLYSFIAAFTVTCTETVSVCPSPTGYLLLANTTLSLNPSLIACANGVLAKRQEDCPPSQPSNARPVNTSFIGIYLPPSQTSSHPCPGSGYSCSECPDGWFCPPSQTAPQSAPCGFGWACGACGGGWFCIPNPTATGDASGLVGPVADVLSSISMSITEAIPPAMGSFTAQFPSLASVLPFAPLTAAGSGSVTCLDGSVVQKAQDCLDGIAGATSLLRAFGAPIGSALGQATNVAGIVVASAATSLNPALAQASGIANNLLNTLAANLNPALGAANSRVGNVQPIATSVVGNAAGNLLSSVDIGAENIAAKATAAANNPPGNIIATAVSVAGNAAGNVVSVGNGVAGIGNIIPTATAVIGNVIANALPGLIKEVQQGGNTISHITTTINGQSTILPVVITVLNGAPTAVPVVNVVVNGASTDLPISNGPLGQPIRLVGRSRPKKEHQETAGYKVWMEEANANGNLV